MSGLFHCFHTSGTQKKTQETHKESIKTNDQYHHPETKYTKTFTCHVHIDRRHLLQRMFIASVRQRDLMGDIPRQKIGGLVRRPTATERIRQIHPRTWPHTHKKDNHHQQQPSVPPLTTTNGSIVLLRHTTPTLLPILLTPQHAARGHGQRFLFGRRQHTQHHATARAVPRKQHARGVHGHVLHQPFVTCDTIVHRGRERMFRGTAVIRAIHQRPGFAHQPHQQSAVCFGRAQRKRTPMQVQNDARNVPQGRGVEMRVARVTWATTATTASGTGGGVKPFALGRAHGVAHHANVRRTQAHEDHPQRRVRAAPQPAPSSGNVVGPGTQRRHGGFERGGPGRVAFGAATATTEDGQDVAGVGRANRGNGGRRSGGVECGCWGHHPRGEEGWWCRRREGRRPACRGPKKDHRSGRRAGHGGAAAWWLGGRRPLD